MEEHISDLEVDVLEVEFKVKDKFCKTYNILETDSRFKTLLDVERSKCNKLIFMTYHLEYLKGRLSEADANTFDGQFHMEETPWLIKKMLSKKTIHVVSRQSGMKVEKSKTQRAKEAKRVRVATLLKLLNDGRFDIVALHDSELKLRLADNPNVIHKCRVSVDDTHRWGDDEYVNLTIYELLVWKVAIDKKQIDLYMNTDTIKLLLKLQSYGDKDLFVCPADIGKTNQLNKTSK